MGSDFGKILYMCDNCSGQVGKGPWQLLLKLSQEIYGLTEAVLGGGVGKMELLPTTNVNNEPSNKLIGVVRKIRIVTS